MTNTLTLPKAGDTVRYISQGKEVTDTVRMFFHADILMEPYARNYSVPAVVLHHVSWLPVSDVELVEAR